MISEWSTVWSNEIATHIRGVWSAKEEPMPERVQDMIRIVLGSTAKPSTEYDPYSNHDYLP